MSLSLAAALIATSMVGAPAAAPAAVICTAEQGFGLRFGAPIDGTSASFAGRRHQVALGPDRQPFGTAEVHVTQDSRMVHRVNATALFRTDAEVRAFITALRDAHRAAGWSPRPESEALMGDLSGIGLPVLDMELALGTGAAERWLEIVTLGRDVMVSCISPQLQRVALREWMAPPHVGAARPQPPVPPAAPALARPDCAAPGALAEMERVLPAWMEQWQPYAEGVSRHYEQLIEWSGLRFVRAGRWTAAQKDAFEAALVERPELSASMQAILQGLTQMVIDLAKVAELEQAGRQREACARVVGMFDQVPRIAALTARQSEAIDRIYRAEAQQLGASLD